jgi:hypothetical protein
MRHGKVLVGRFIKKILVNNAVLKKKTQKSGNYFSTPGLVLQK